MKTGWLLVLSGVALMSLGVWFFGGLVLAIHNWRAILFSIAGMVLLLIGVRRLRGMSPGRALFVALGSFLCLLGGYVLFREEWHVFEAPESMLLLVGGLALLVIGLRVSAGRQIAE